MKALLWKDYRVNKPVLLVGFCLLTAPYLCAVGWVSYDVGLLSAPAIMWSSVLMIAAQASLYGSQLTVALLAGNIIAGERRDLSAEFLCYLPPSRTGILRSKALLSAIIIGIIWGLSLIVIELVVPAIAGDKVNTRSIEAMRTAHKFVAAGGVTMFGMGWFASSFLENPTYFTGVGVMSAVAVPFLLNFSLLLTGWPQSGEVFVRVLLSAYVVLGIAGFIGGWLYFVRRVEP